MKVQDTTYEWLDDDAEREFLTTVDPAEVLANAHRVYEWLRERGVAPDSVIREAAFAKASEALGIDYDVLYDAWLGERAVNMLAAPGATSDGAVRLRVLGVAGQVVDVGRVSLPEIGDAAGGLYVQAFNPEAHDGLGEVTTTSDREKAARWPTIVAALEAWQAVPASRPTRPDGKPNRPLTAFTVELVIDDGLVTP